ncbi:hypothetical protein [Streptomyces lavendulae]
MPSPSTTVVRIRGGESLARAEAATEDTLVLALGVVGGKTEAQGEARR